MPRKIRQLKVDLRRAGFVWRPAKGSHGVWESLDYPDITITLSGNDGQDAQPYQERDVRNALAAVQRRREATNGRTD